MINCDVETWRHSRAGASGDRTGEPLFLSFVTFPRRSRAFRVAHAPRVWKSAPSPSFRPEPQAKHLFPYRLDFPKTPPHRKTRGRVLQHAGRVRYPERAAAPPARAAVAK